ncbi:TolC family protein [Actomonas aquatica]|uniref:TolC family protein n=1 Tax=Actomonas aquatica TaxID=2866162 RepID=A0ABZ1CBS2_9BACT|nr:TolC family protein [Opitutus sp. WL0086]WRQ89126.1 TolC family protein [Opitutus sp. WL0086]
MSRTLRTVCLAALTLSATASAQEPVLTLEEAVARALEKNFAVEIQRYTTETAVAAVEIADANFDPSFFVSATKSVNQQAQPSSTLDGVSQEGPRSENTTIRAGARQRIITGADIELGANLNRRETNSTFSLLNPAYASDFSLTVSQPLLAGFGSEVNRAALKRARLGLERAGLDFESALLDIVRNVETAYYNLAFAREQLAVREFSLAVAQGLLEENQTRLETGVATDLDVLQAQVGVANANRGVLLAQQTVKDREDALKNLITQFELDRPIGDIVLQPVTTPNVSFAESYNLARNNRPDYASAVLAVEQYRIDERTATNGRRPSLNLDAGVGLNSNEGSASDSTSNLWDGEGYSWQLGLSLNVPWGFKEEKARLAQARAVLSREEVRLRQLEQNIMVDVRAAIRSVQTSAESFQISQLATKLSQDQYNLEKARFDAGLSTFRRVQESQEDLDTARVNEIQAAVNLRIALAELSRLEGSSLDRFGITLEAEE